MNSMRRLTIRAGTMMHPRHGGRGERARHDRDVLAMPSSSPHCTPGSHDCWSFVWTRRNVKEFWYVLHEDVTYPDDFPDEEGYRR